MRNHQKSSFYDKTVSFNEPAVIFIPSLEELLGSIESTCYVVEFCDLRLRVLVQLRNERSVESEE